MLPGFCSRGHSVLKKKLFEEFQDDCLMHGHLWYLNGMIWAIQALLQALHFALMPPIKFLLKRMYGLEEDIVWSTEDSCHGGTTQWFCLLWDYNPQANALQIKPLRPTNMHMVSWVFNSSEKLPYHTQSFKHIHGWTIHTCRDYTTGQHTKTLFCGEIIF